MSDEKRYWFPAKRYGWGWGIPATWQGWVVFVGFFALLLLGVIIFPPDQRVGWYLSYVAVLTFALLLICWKKGEPPRWRWGRD